MRKNYLDNLRNLVILLLFPVHTFMVWNDFGLKFYIWGGENKVLSTLIVLVNPWFMPLLFVIAGISARFSLEKRTVKEFCRERVNKLLIPFIAGTILLVPIQTFYARKFFYGYDGSIIENMQYFFTHVTDFSGYDGGFTPGHLWFILFLFLISLISLIFQKYIPFERVRDKVGKMKAWMVIGLFISVWLLYYVGNIGGYSIGKNLILYLLGYYVLGNDSIMEKLERNVRWITTIWIVLEIVLGIAYYQYSYYGDFGVNLVGWFGVLVILTLGKCFLDRETAFTRYFRKASFPIYILHQSILVALAYYVLNGFEQLVYQIILILFGSFILTVLCYQIIKYVPVVRKLLGAG